MFEEEAEERTRQYASKHIEKYNCENTKLETDNYNVGLETGYEAGFQDGAEFGYNKANEWHYPSKGEYPKDDTDVLVAYYTRFNVDTKQPSGELECKIAGFLGKKWYNTDTGCGDIDDWLNKPDMVYAWKEIKLPKEVLK